jgi:hypothetical protein
MSARQFRLSVIFWLLAPVALLRRLRRRRSGWVAAEPRGTAREP